jgi:hypothetical protein
VQDIGEPIQMEDILLDSEKNFKTVVDLLESSQTSGKNLGNNVVSIGTLGHPTMTTEAKNDVEVQDLMHRIVQAIPNLRILRINMMCPPSYLAVVSSVSSANLQCLCVGFFGENSDSVMLHHIGEFKNLRRLSINFIDFPSFDSYVPPALSLPRLQHFRSTLMAPANADFYGWLAK